MGEAMSKTIKGSHTTKWSNELEVGNCQSMYKNIYHIQKISMVC